MQTNTSSTAKASLAADTHALHRLGVACGLAAGVWLGAAEAPTKLVNVGLSPFAVSLWMVAGVFTARWTFPTLLKGTSYVVRDLAEKKHLIVWALLAGALWAVANTLTVFAIRDVGLAIAFPLWNANSLFGLLWGRVLFRELQGASRGGVAKVLLGATAIVAAAILLGFSTVHGGGHPSSHAARGIAAAIGASALWGTMYVPYRKAYISGMNPLSFVTAFTFGELGSVLALVWWLDGGVHSTAFHLSEFRGVLFWLFLGGFVWVIGDLFQQFTAKYLGIGRGIPLSNTNQLWGLAWGALVFGELAGTDLTHKLMVLGGSVIMILGALAISTAVAGEREHHSRNLAIERECNRYSLDYGAVLAAQAGSEFDAGERRRWWDYAIVTSAVAVFLWLGVQARVPEIAMNRAWLAALVVLLIASLLYCGLRLRRQTGFS
ncbi:MAG TPA: EamA/RhaT family transporter [Acidobacteriaceae bacterium]